MQLWSCWTCQPAQRLPGVVAIGEQRRDRLNPARILRAQALTIR
jgi:hypothetical protein